MSGRVIKFRAWNKDHGKMHFGSSNLMLDLSGNHYWQFGDDAPMPIPKDEQTCILMQFTGLHDKNGVEIYEGDILAWKPSWTSCNEPPQVVEFNGSGYDPFQYSGGGEWHHLDAEVIGNIHEN
jgi:uncharacterized phage protein (TIGR01671 family)